MAESHEILLHRMAENYAACVVPIPGELGPAHLPVPQEEQEIVYEGLVCLHGVIASAYLVLLSSPIQDDRARSDEDYCWKTVDGPPVLLWGMGVAGNLQNGPEGLELVVNRAELEKATLGRKIKGLPGAAAVLERAGLIFACRNSDGSICSKGLKKCDVIATRYAADPARNEPLLRALRFFAASTDFRQSKIPLATFQRADCRIFLPGADPEARTFTEQEALCTLDAMTVSLWQEMARYAAERYPKYIQTFRVPDLRHRTWIANYSTDGKGYGVWSIIGEDGGFRVRMVLKAKGRTYLLDHIDELAPKMQETFLQRTSCTNCKNCGKHQMFQHGDHIHKLCAGAWFYSPYLEKDDLPSIQRLLDIHLAHLR